MADDTEFLAKPAAAPLEQINGSHLFNISIRGWLAVMVIFTICLMSFLKISIDEPLKAIGLLTIGFYFGQTKK